jgi:hypothetical protein
MSINKQIKIADLPILQENGAYRVPHQAWTNVYDNGTLTGGSTDFVFDCNNSSVQKVTITGTINDLKVINHREGACYVLIVTSAAGAFTSFNNGTVGAEILTEGGFALGFSLTSGGQDVISIIGKDSNTVLLSSAKDFKA